MKQNLIIAALFAVALAACSKPEAPKTDAAAPAAPAAAPAPAATPAPAAAPAAPAAPAAAPADKK
ncbi:MAG: hypothetical protein KGN31_08460 [Betaproteobacteria bacterium]|nr:hypothetical protein [Betaproteobacteria bacterium]MDE2424222.1 hypothetical protein [Betaproteobacteria bacterium]